MSYSKSMRLNEWPRMFEDIYFLSQNLERDRYRVFAHLVEVTGGLTQASVKLDDYDRSIRFLGKVFAWYCALLKALNYSDLEIIVWTKFPGVCPYCRERECECALSPSKPDLDSESVRTLALRHADDTPADLYSWQLLFDRIYRQRRELLDAADPSAAARSELARYTARFVEELGEIAEAMRLEYFYPNHLRNEVADVFAWVCGIANILPIAFGETRPLYLADAVFDQYPSRCPHCNETVWWDPLESTCRHASLSIL